MKKFSLFFILGIFLIGIVSATTYCCEKSNSGASCQNVNDLSLCDVSVNPITGQSYRAVTSFCEATSYCKLGTCINQQEGTCMTSPQIVCQNNNGFWSTLSQDKLAQCKLGCCLVGNQAAFVTQVACNRMASLYGLDVNYRADIQNELTCLESANPDVKGACVYAKDSITTCELTTKKDCQDLAKSKTDAVFHEGFLCSAQQLGTICAKSKNTRCEGDSVYFVDTCGNLANIYDANRVNEENYWTYIQEPTCGNGAGNKDSATCGACDYYYGSMCSNKGSRSVSYGDNICKSLDCESYRGQYSFSKSSNKIATATDFPKHGDTWCSTDNRNGGTANSPGSTNFRLICYNGEVTTEECGNGDSGGTRQEICGENSSTRAGNCKINAWQDCTNQTTKADCENIDVRDCSWVTYAKYTSTNTEACSSGYNQSVLFGLIPTASIGGLGNVQVCNYNSYSFSDQGLTDMSNTNGTCVPKYSPGFNRDGSDTTIGGETCGQSNSVCIVTYEKTGAFGGWKCVQNCACEKDSWAQGLNGICSNLGDCGVKTNYIGKTGTNTITNSYSIQNNSGGSQR